MTTLFVAGSKKEQGMYDSATSSIWSEITFKFIQDTFSPIYSLSFAVILISVDSWEMHTVPVKRLDTSTHSRVFLYFLLFSTLQNNSEGITLWNDTNGIM
jgi:hypothetical protein